mmetsp:Transcript_7689/g.11644  ORF Transcript_7689/g.11644 Transcript_7689/m.11644 type:complete len:194 (-) Transcript_7689:217-798(-)
MPSSKKTKKAHPTEILKLKLVSRYRQTCVASRNVRQLFLYLGGLCCILQVVRAATSEALYLEGVIFETLSGMASVFGGLFISQTPDMEQALLSFKMAFGISCIQTLIFVAFLNGDIYLPKESFPLGTFFFAICWGLDRFMLYSLDRSLKLIAQLSSISDDIIQSKGKKKKSERQVPKEASSENKLKDESKKDK